MSKTNLYAASRQWAERPPDERFWTLSELYHKTREYAEESRVYDVPLSECEIIPYKGEDLALVGPNGQPATFQNYSFGQLAGMCAAPASYLRELPAELAASNLNNKLRKIEGTQKLLFHKNGGLQLRAITSAARYQRIWNYEVADLALALEENEGWKVPPARPSGHGGISRLATAEDVLRNSAHPSMGIKVGDTISPAGLYASDHDLFIFQVNESRTVDGGGGEQLYRGVFWTNSEVGDAKFKATLFLYESICGNHIVWGAKTLAEVSIRHTGEARKMFAEAMSTISDRMDRSVSDDQKRIAAAKIKLLGASREEVVTFAFGKNFGLSKAECENAYVLADRHADEHGGNPNSAWGYAAGITRLSQQKFADKRDVMDRAAGKILETAF
jgi:hypothetical protein